MAKSLTDSNKSQIPAPNPQQPQQFNGIIPLPSLPGVRRDGTVTDSEFYTDAQWCRFVQGRPQKIGGYQESIRNFSGPLRGGFLWASRFLSLYCGFSHWGVEYSYIGPEGTGGEVHDITPSEYVKSEQTMWAYDYLFDAAAGENSSLIIASPTQTLSNMDDPTETGVFVTPLNSPTIMTQVEDSAAVASGGIFCSSPYTILLGGDGNATWSDANSPQTYSSGDAGTARVTGTKIVCGLPMRTGISTGGLMWSLDSLIRMDYIGGSAIFKFSHLSTKSSILSQRSVVEYDGKWYWIGIDRFMVTNGVQLEELQNDLNLHWFFDNLNFSQRQKVFALRVPKYGEIWWFFPSGDSEECDCAIIYNLRSKIWYDTRILRSSGVCSSTYPYPLMSSSVPNQNLRMSVVVEGEPSWAVGDYLLGVSSGASGCIQSIQVGETYTLEVLSTNSGSFISGEELTLVGGSITATVVEIRSRYSLFSHEKGKDANDYRGSEAIPSHFTTCEFGAPTGSAQANAPLGYDRNTRITRIEPDFNMSGEMTVQTITSTFAQSESRNGKLYTFGPDTGKIDLREQAREFRLKFSSNVLNGDYHGGRTLVHLEPGDIRP